MTVATHNIKVMSVCTSDVSGGAARAAYRIHQGGRALGVDSRMFVKNKGSQDPNVHSLSEFIPNNLMYHALDWCAAKVKNKIQHFQWNKYPNRDANFKSDLRGTDIHGALHSWDYDVLQLHWINQRFIKIDDLQKVHKPIVWTLHDSWPFCGVCHIPFDCENYKRQCGNCPQLASKDWRDLSYQVWRHKADVYKYLDLHIVTPSHWLADCAKRSALFRNFPITVIPNCIDTEVYQPMDKRKTAEALGLDPNKRYILFGAMQATTDKNKGFDLLVDALKQMPKFDVELIVYGTNENLDKYNLPFLVRSFGYIQSDKYMAQLYNIADVTVVPSRSENLSNTIMESMACGTPVVAFNIGGNNDMIDHLQNGYLAIEQNSEDLAQGIQYCFENNANQNFGMAALNKVINTYTQKIISKQYVDLYQSLI